MIVAAGRPDDTFVLALATTGVLALAALVVARARGAPVLRVRADAFARVDLGLAFGMFVLAFFVYALCLVLVLGKLGLAGRWAGVLAAIPLVVGVDRLILRRWFRPRGSRLMRLGEGLWVLCAVLPLVYGLLYLLTAVYGELALQDEVIALMERRAGWKWTVAAAVVVAPLVEELLFRGLLYPALRQVTTVPIAMVLSGVLFGLMHPIHVAAPLALLGVALAWLAESTGSLWPGIVAHTAFNALTVVQVLIS